MPPVLPNWMPTSFRFPKGAILFFLSLGKKFYDVLFVFTKLHFPVRLANNFDKRFANMKLGIDTKFVFLL